MLIISNFVSRYAFWLLLCVCPVVVEAAGESAKQWLEQMSAAMGARSYSGTFIYMNNKKIEAMKIDHRNFSEGVSERLLSLNGSPREIIRNNEVVTCAWLDTKTTLIDKSGTKNHFPAKLPKNLDVIEKHYTIDVAGDDRVADRRCKLIDIVSKDKDRYGYRLCVDQDSKLMLMSVVMDENQQPIEHVMFTNLEVERDHAQNEPLKPRYSRDGFKVHVQQALESSEESAAGIVYLEPEKLPAGFSLMNAYRKHVGEDNKTINHLVYSDGMATVSVFVERHGGDEKMLQGNSRMGVVHAFGKHVGDLHITVVGEVPQSTVNAIGALIQPAPPEQ